MQEGAARKEQPEGDEVRQYEDMHEAGPGQASCIGCRPDRAGHKRCDADGEADTDGGHREEDLRRVTDTGDERRVLQPRHVKKR